MLAPLLRRAFDGNRIAQAFQGFDRPLPLACLLSRVPLIVSGLLITRPQSEEMVDDHENFVGDSQRGLLLADTHFETPKGTSEEGGRFPGTPGTLYQDPAEVAIPLARFASISFASTLVIPGTGGRERKAYESRWCF